MTNVPEQEVGEGHHFYDDCPCPMFVYDLDTFRILNVNKAAVSWYGYSPTEFAKMSLFDLTITDDMGRIKQTAGNIRELKNIDSGYWMNIKKNGETRFVHTFSSATIYYGRPARIVLAIDIGKKQEPESKNTELLAATQQLVKRYENILSSLPVMVCKLSLDRHTPIYLNKACELITGYTISELLADSSMFFRSIHPDDLTSFNEAFDLLNDQESAPFNFRFIHKNGSTRELSGAIKLLKDMEGSLYSYSGYLIDITLQRKIERDFHEKAKEIEDLLESITDAFFAADKDWIITYANCAAERLYGLKRENIIGRSAWEVFPNVPGTIFYDEYVRSVSENVPVTVVGLSPTSGRWVQSSAYPTSNGIAVLFKDITEQKRLAEEINKNAQNIYALINNTQDFIWSVDHDLKVIYINDSCMNATKQEFNITFSPGSYILPAELGEAFITARKAYYSRALKGEAFTVTDDQVLKDGVLYRETSFNPIKDSTGTIIGVSCFSRNVTDQRKHLLEIEKQNERMKEIAWIQSHKIRGPLATIMGLADLLDAQGITGIDNKIIIKGMAEKAKELDNMVKEIVNISESRSRS